MHIRVLRASLAIVLVGCLLPSVCSAGLAVSLVPLREVYHPGEPVAVLLTLKNTGESEISVSMNRYFDLPLGSASTSSIRAASSQLTGNPASSTCSCTAFPWPRTGSPIWCSR